MPTRELVALVLVPLVLGAILWLPAWVFLTLLGMVVVGAQIELLAMARAADIPCGRVLPAAGLAGLLAACWWFGSTGATVASIAVVVLLTTAQLAHPSRPRGGLTGAAVSCFSVLYLGLTAACMGWLRLMPGDNEGAVLIVFFLVCIWIGDSGAYYVGRNIGRHHMSPRISPKKTWEGLIGGAVSTIAAGAACKVVLGLSLSWNHTLAVAAILAVAAPVGDLVESLFKRDTGVKDSSTLLLGHGGLLDRTDSLLYATPAVLGYLLVTGALT
jgi:phosphatidate cytidylyltransferase